MLVHGEEFHPGSRSVFFGKLRDCCARSFIYFRNHDERAARLRYPENFAHVTVKVGPPEVGFDGRDQVEGALRKWKLRDGALANLDAARLDPLFIYFTGDGDALFGMIDSVDLSLAGHGCQLAYRSAAATTDVEDPALRRDRNVRQAPVGDLGVAGVHVA